LAATGVAVILASATVASAFQLPAKGTAAAWRTDITKKNNAYTTCILTAWGACEKTASTPPNTGTGGLDCDVSVRPVTGNTATAGTAAIAVLEAALVKCDAKVAGTGAQVGTAKIGLSAKRPGGALIPPASLTSMNLKDIGCLGDCGPAEGTQPCLDVEAWEAAELDPTINSFKTALALADPLSFIYPICGQDDCMLVGGTPVPPVAACTGPKNLASGTTTNLFAKGVIAYTTAIIKCAQACQDDLGTKKGGGFFDDGTACVVPSVLTPLTNGFHACVAGAQANMAKVTTTVKQPSCNTMNAFVMGLVTTAVNAATTAGYDRVDLQTQYLVEAITDSTNPFFVASNPTVEALVGGLSDRVSAGSGKSFGTACATGNDSALEDYEECDAPNNSLCGIIPGTKAGACPTADDAVSKQSAGRCPR
jgi:hypothetical protein